MKHGRTTQEDAALLEWSTYRREIARKRNITNAGAHKHTNTHKRKKKREKEKRCRKIEVDEREIFDRSSIRKGHGKHIGRQILVNFSTLQKRRRVGSRDSSGGPI